MRGTTIVLSLIGSISLIGCVTGISEEKMESGKKVYQKYCQSCHMDSGGGVPHMNAPLAGSVNVAGNNEKLISIVLHGSAALANEPGRKYQNKMPSLANLTDQEIADVLTYTRNSFTNKGPAIEPEDVKAVRQKTN